jgi:hypothetical protein
MNSPNESEGQQRQIKIDADIDQVIKTIQGLGLNPDEKTTATDNHDEDPIPSRNRRMRLVVITITIFAIGAFAGFVGAYNLHAPNGASDISSYSVVGNPPRNSGRTGDSEGDSSADGN